MGVREPARKKRDQLWSAPAFGFGGGATNSGFYSEYDADVFSEEFVFRGKHMNLYIHHIYIYIYIYTAYIYSINI